MSAQGRELVIDVTGLQMRYGSTTVLEGISLAVGRGEVVALLGPNGAGKTTTIKILEGFRPRSAGSVTVLGVDPDRGDDAWRARLGIVLQSWRDHSKWRVRSCWTTSPACIAPTGPRVGGSMSCWPRSD